MNKWCEKCEGSYPIYTCKLDNKLINKYQVINHCMNGGKECQKKINSLNKEQTKKLVLKKRD